MDCIKCGVMLPEEGYYCPRCLTQVRCKGCEGYLILDTNGCIHCGSPISTGVGMESNLRSVAGSLARNRIVLKETQKSRSIEAEFTDEVARDLVGLWTNGGQLVADRPDSLKSIPATLLAPTEGAAGPEMIDTVGQVVAPAVESDTNDDRRLLKQIFRYIDGKLQVKDTNFKVGALGIFESALLC